MAMQRIAFILGLMLSAAPVAAATSTYQVTGPVLDVTDTKIVVEKDKEKWEIERDKDTKVTGELKKGSRVTIQYSMTATRIEAKEAKGKGETKQTKDTKDAGKK